MPHTEQYHTVKCTLTKSRGPPTPGQCMAKVVSERAAAAMVGSGMGGFSWNGGEVRRGEGEAAPAGARAINDAVGRDARSADEAARSQPGPLLPRWALGVAWLGCGNEERAGVSRRVDANQSPP